MTLIIFLNSPSLVPFDPRQLAFCNQGYSPANWRWTRRSISHLLSQRGWRFLCGQQYAPPQGYIRTRRRRLLTRAVGNPSHYVGIPTVQWRPSCLPGPAVRNDGGHVYNCENGAGVRRYTIPWRTLQGEALTFLDELQRCQSYPEE
jgi:hypothetical protein